MPKVIWKPGTMLYPVPAVMVTAKSGERDNIITISWVGTVCTNPPMLSISVRPERYSYALIKESGEFVVNLPGKHLAFAADFCGVRSGRDVSKFDFLKLTREPASQVQAPIIKEAPLAIECKVTQVLELGSHHMFIAEVVAVQVDEALIDETGKLHLDQAELIAYNHGQYCLTHDLPGKFGFSVERKRLAEYMARRESSREEPESGSRDCKTGMLMKEQDRHQVQPNRTERRKDMEPGDGQSGKKRSGEAFFGERGREAGSARTFGSRGGKKRERESHYGERGTGGSDLADKGGKGAGGNKPYGAKGRGGKSETFGKVGGGKKPRGKK